MYDNGLPLLIKPVSAGRPWPMSLVATRTYISHTNFDVVFDLATQRVYGVTFKAHPDATSKRLWSVGRVDDTTGY